MYICPCCSERLLRHTRNGGVYWFCSHCWQEMPALSGKVSHPRQRLQRLENRIDNLSVASN
ncbi:MAG: hypothetical protein F6K19_34535 [Cyanothece sp. SIO1E1]|nr:hypothetical protein [Cyanothece sp. SIO1E1]